MLSACSALRVPQKPSRASPFVDFCSTTFLQPCKTFGFAYPGCKNVIYLERYAQVFESAGKYV
jgi:hypothetical protein